MATATLVPVRSFDSLPAATQRNATKLRQQMEQQRHREGIEELRKNGIIVSNVWEDEEDEPVLMSRALNCKQMWGVEDCVSRPDAVEMSAEDIANVSQVTPADINDRMNQIAAKFVPSADNPSAYDQWERWGADWRDDDVRWTLTPNQLKKLPAKLKKT